MKSDRQTRMSDIPSVQMWATTEGNPWLERRGYGGVSSLIGTSGQSSTQGVLGCLTY